MKVILEKPDLLKILSKEFGYDLNDNDVEVTTSPFEVQVSHLPVDQLASKPGVRAPENTAVPYTEEEEEEDEDEEKESYTDTPVDKSTETFSMEELLAQNEEISNRGTKNPTPGFARDNEAVYRPVGQTEYRDPPPISPSELAGGLRALERLSGAK